jgi:hypothetical protein
MESAELMIFPLPDCMSLPETPIRTLALDGEQVFCISSSNDLTALIANSARPQSGEEQCNDVVIDDNSSPENMEMH